MMIKMTRYEINKNLALKNFKTTNNVDNKSAQNNSKKFNKKKIYKQKSIKDNTGKNTLRYYKKSNIMKKNSMHYESSFNRKLS